MTEIQIRHVRDEDVDAIHRTLEAAHVTRGTMRLPFHSRETVRERIRHGEGVIKLVAVQEGKVAGYAELHDQCGSTAPPRRRDQHDCHASGFSRSRRRARLSWSP